MSSRLILHIFGNGMTPHLFSSIESNVERIFIYNGMLVDVVGWKTYSDWEKIGSNFYAPIIQASMEPIGSSNVGFTPYRGAYIDLKSKTWVSIGGIKNRLAQIKNPNISFNYAVSYIVAHELLHQLFAAASYVNSKGKAMTAGGTYEESHSAGDNLNSSAEILSRIDVSKKKSIYPWEVIPWDLKKDLLNPWYFKTK